MSYIKIQSNYGVDWEDAVDANGDIKPRAFWVHDGHGSSLGLSVEDVEELASKLVHLRELSEIANRPKLPTKPGLYESDHVSYVLTNKGQWFVLWSEELPGGRTAEEMIENANIGDLKRVA